jgi:hypothetical protein
MTPEDFETLQARLERIERKLFPEDFRKPEPEIDPVEAEVERLMGPPKDQRDARYLKQRFTDLTRGCFPHREQRQAELSEYIEGGGNYLPPRYRHPRTPEVITDRDTEADITADVAEEQKRAAAKRAREERREDEAQAQKNASDLGYSDPYALYEAYGLKHPDTPSRVASDAELEMEGIAGELGA